MAIGSLLKVVIGLGGIVTTMVVFAIGIVRKDKQKLKRAGLFFVATWVILLVLGGIEFVLLANA